MKILRKKIYLLFALCILGHSYQLNGQDEAQTSIVEVQGIGKDADGALKSAIYQAVQQAVGAYVDQETVIKNEEVIQDKLLSVSQGFVDSYDIISPAVERRDGSTLWEIKIKAVVKKSEVGAALRTAGIMQVQADGSSGWAKQITMLKNQDDAMKLLEDLLPQIPKNLICARIIEDKNIKTRQDLHTGDLLVEVQIEYDTNAEWWKKEAYPALDAALTALCLIEKPPQSVELNAKKVRNHYRINDKEEPLNQDVYPPIRIFNPTNKYRTSWIQREYHIPTIRMEEFISISKKTLICNEEIEINTLEFCDSEGLSILKIPVFPGKYDGSGYDIGSGSNKYGYPLSIPILICGGYTSSPAILGGNGILKQMYIMPEFFSHTSENFTAGFNYKPNPILVTYSFKVDPDVLKNTKTLKLLPGHFGVTEKPFY